MKKMRIFALILMVLALLPVTLLGVFASDGEELLIDRADLLTSSQEEQLAERLAEASARLDFDFVILIVDGTGGRDILDYADDFKRKASYRQDASILVIDMENRDWWVAPYGFGEKAINEDAIYHDLEDRLVPSLSAGNYADAFERYLDGAEKLVEDGKNGDFYVYIPWGRNILIALAVGAVVALITVLSMRSQLKSVAFKSSAAGYVRQGSFKLTREKDIFLYRTHTRVYSPQQKSSGSGSRGGGSRGGGGKF